ncbi:MAG: hypothetical protein U0Q11_21175 [Vicinamibacterales bacterium]
MKRLLHAVLLVALGAVSAAAQSQPLPPPFPRTNATKLFENDRINVWDIVWPKGQPTALHRHVYDQVGTYYAKGGRTITTPDGQARSNITEIGALSDTKRGTTHVEEGNTDPPLRAVFIELKQDEPSGAASASAIGSSFPRDSAKQVMDTPRVAAWDVVWSATGASPLRYQASRETVIVFLGDGQVRRSTGIVPVKSGTMMHLDRGTPERLELVSGSPRVLFFELK